MCFFDCASVLTKSVDRMTFSVAGYILNVAFIELYHINEIGRRAGDVMSYASLFVGREKSVRCGSLCGERIRLVPISVTTGQRKAPEAGRGEGACLFPSSAFANWLTYTLPLNL